ncbi:MAG: toxin [Candidatus Levybacteria bacterium RBG_13_35_9]|nr:MAG: toxin [Candidatus Levybacteria bacterium RBG_13_35_9]
MKYFDWDKKKNEYLKTTRDLCFEDVVAAIDNGQLLDTLEHPNQTRYPNQQIYIVNINGYAYVVPFVEDKEKCFLKTIFPSRKMTEKYIIKD